MIPRHNPAMLRTMKILAFGFILLPAHFPAQAKTVPRAVLIEHVTVIDGTGGPPVRNVDVLVQEGRIRAVAEGMKAPPHVRVMRSRGKFLIPGLIDMHAHVAYLDWATRDGRPFGTYDRATSERTLQLMLAWGITTVRNPAAPTLEGVELRDDVAAAKIQGPRIFTAGEILNRAAAFDGLARPVANEADIRSEIAGQASAGVDFIKLYANLPPELVRAAIRSAHEHHLRAIGHLQATTWREAAEEGIDGLCHAVSWSADELPPERRAAYRSALEEQGAMKARMTWLESVDPGGVAFAEMVDSLVRHQVVVDPTLVAYESKFKGDDPKYLQNPDLALAPPKMRASFPRISFVGDWSVQDFQRGRALWPKMLRIVKAYADAGVLLTAGSDEPNAWLVPGASLHAELELLAETGIAPKEVIRIATRNGAQALGILDEVGSIEVGKQADLVLLTSDPTTDIRNTRRIEWVMRQGVIYEPRRLLKGVEGD